MTNSSTSPLRFVLETAIAFAPWVISMYMLYWLDYGEIWNSETPHRGKIAVAILAVGMALSFLIKSRFDIRKRS
jgi:membrane protein DedA with SNARE-associated domain